MKRKPFKLIIIIVISFVLASIILILFQNKDEIAASIFLIEEENTQVCFKNYCFNVELAIKPEQRRQGLMFRDHLDLDKGMLFVFKDEARYSFWMKNTLIPLDIIWINRNKEIVFISHSTQPCEKDPCPSIIPTQKAKYVLEINQGISKKIDLKVGDKIDFNI